MITGLMSELRPLYFIDLDWILIRFLCGLWVLRVLLDLNTWWSSFRRTLGYDERCCVILFPEQRAEGLLRVVTYSLTRYACVRIWSGFHVYDLDVFMLTISILWCLDWHLFNELPRGDDKLYVPVSLLVHHECPPVNLLLPGHLLALVDAFDKPP